MKRMNKSLLPFIALIVSFFLTPSFTFAEEAQVVYLGPDTLSNKAIVGKARTLCRSLKAVVKRCGKKSDLIWGSMADKNCPLSIAGLATEDFKLVETATSQMEGCRKTKGCRQALRCAEKVFGSLDNFAEEVAKKLKEDKAYKTQE